MSNHAPSPNGHCHAPGGIHSDSHAAHGAHHGDHGMPKWWKITIFLVVVTITAYGLASGKMTTSFHYLAGSVEGKSDVFGNFWNVLIGYPAIGCFIWWLMKPAH